MSDLGFYFMLGWQHIISLDAFDHQLFILALIVLYTIPDWRQVLILVTAFTIGHSVTLVLSTLNIVTIPSNLIEFLIPCTIVITATSNMLQPKPAASNLPRNYVFALFFGLVHGLGFANALKFMLARDQNLGLSLFSFNLGLEAGQIALVVVLLLLTHIFVTKFNISRRCWIILISAGIILVSLKIAIDRFPT